MSPGTGVDCSPRGVTARRTEFYCLDGDFMMPGGSLTGDGVIIYLRFGQMHIEGGVQLNLHAPRSGKYEGLLIYQPMENKNRLVLNAASGSSVYGTILAPGAEIASKAATTEQAFTPSLSATDKRRRRQQRVHPLRGRGQLRRVVHARGPVRPVRDAPPAV
jgi:hypothetical protein